MDENVSETYCVQKGKLWSTLVQSKYTEDPSLGIWVSTQRGSYKKSRLSNKRIGLLNFIDFAWSARR